MTGYVIWYVVVWYGRYGNMKDSVFGIGGLYLWISSDEGVARAIEGMHLSQGG